MGNRWPWLWQFIQYGGNRFRPGEDVLKRLIGFANHENRARCFRWITAEFGQERRTLFGAGSGKSKSGTPITPDQPPNQAIAKVALAIEDDQKPTAGLFVCPHAFPPAGWMK
jgi:hypothetical protein